MGQGYQAAKKLIAQLRAKTYRKLDDDELLEFRKEMIEHLGGTLKESIDEALDHKIEAIEDSILSGLAEMLGMKKSKLFNDIIRMNPIPARDLSNLAKHLKPVLDGMNEGSITRYNQGDDISLLAREVAKIIGINLDPAEFYEYLHDYSRDKLYGEYGLDADELEVLEDAFAEIEQEAVGQTNINTSKVKATELYKQYIKY
jgi:hypothetical protein